MPASGGRSPRTGEFTDLRPATVRVEVVEPGRAVITGPLFSGTATLFIENTGDELTRPRQRYLVELTSSATLDHDEIDPNLGLVSSYDAAARRLATAHGLRGKAVRVERACERAADPRTPNGLPMLPEKLRYRLAQLREPQFRRWPEDGTGWVLLGPAAALPVGEVVRVARYGDSEVTPMRISRWRAEYRVSHRGGIDELYVAAEFQTEE